jgi:hypothetical protein
MVNGVGQPRVLSRIAPGSGTRHVSPPGRYSTKATYRELALTNHHIVRRERVCAGAAKLLGDVHVKSAGVFQDLAEHGGGDAPVVAGGVLS